MAFPRKLLNEGEDIVAELRPHWWVFAKPAALVVLLFVLATVAQIMVDNPVLTFVLAGAGMVALVWLGARYLKWATTVFVVTTDRLILRSGVLSKQGKEIPLERLNDIAVSQTLFERMLRSGDVVLESGGERGQTVVSNIPRPFQVQNVVYAEIERAQNRTADRIAGQRGMSVPEQLEKLDELRQRGVITQAEFEVKKTQLLDRL
jgi:uncharacterized membrane protein YdbT with pleckstrin-like domain